MTRAVDVAGRELPPNTALGTRNLIINGDMRIAQRGTSVTGITGAGYYTCDRFDTGGTAFGTYTQSQDTDVPTGQGFANSIKFLWTTANASLGASSFLQMHQSIEGQNLQHLKKGTANAESITLSFWVKSNKTGTYIVNLWDIDNTRLIAKSYTVNTANTWEKKTLTFAGDTVIGFDNDNGRSLDLTFGLCAGTDNSSGTLQTTWGAAVAVNRYVGQVNLADAINNYINFTGVQLEVGEEATEFEHRPFVDELKRCQRYLNTSFEYGTAIAASSVNTHNGERHSVGQGCTYWATNSYFPTKMRAAPEVTFYYHDGTTQSVNRAAGWNNGTVFNTGWDAVATDSSRVNVEWNMNGQTASGRCYLFFEWKAEAEL